MIDQCMSQLLKFYLQNGSMHKNSIKCILMKLERNYYCIYIHMRCCYYCWVVKRVCTIWAFELIGIQLSDRVDITYKGDVHITIMITTTLPEGVKATCCHYWSATVGDLYGHHDSGSKLYHPSTMFHHVYNAKYLNISFQCVNLLYHLFWYTFLLHVEPNPMIIYEFLNSLLHIMPQCLPIENQGRRRLKCVTIFSTFLFYVTTLKQL